MVFAVKLERRECLILGNAGIDKSCQELMVRWPSLSFEEGVGSFNHRLQHRFAFGTDIIPDRHGVFLQCAEYICFPTKQ